VLVHGLGVSSTYFTPLARLLAEGQRIVAPDLPGFGRSERPTRALDVDSAAAVLAAMLTNEGLDTPLLVANSLGCQIVIELARSKPQLVGGLVLIGPTVDPRYRSWIRQSSALMIDWWREPRSLWPIIVRDDIPSQLRHGLFAEPRTYRAWVRYSGPGPIWSVSRPSS
jgi:pimeloyl-ACP methyl ester carboxylesterase